MDIRELWNRYRTDQSATFTRAELTDLLDDLRIGAIRAGYMLGYEDCQNGNANVYVMQSAIAWQQEKGNGND